jgi:1,4-alpha-glucan branching enzyme
MIHKSQSPLPGHVRVVFELPSCVWADRIFLTGDFNDWKQNDIRLRQDRRGVWQASLDLPAGRTYEFRYVVDGQWRTDSHADGFADNSFGSQNSIVKSVLPEMDFAFEDTGLIRESRPLRPFGPPVVVQRQTQVPWVQVAA